MIGRLHVITDFHFQQVFSHADLAGLAARGGADSIQFRQKLGSDRHIYHAARATKDVLEKLANEELIDVPLIIDDYVSLSILLNAAGVHLGQNDVPISATRSALGHRAIIGASATSIQQATAAASHGADYIGFGPVFPTRSKNNPSSVKGLDGLEAVCRVVSIPVIAIGGVTPENTREILDTGAHGVAVMTNITTSSDPRRATRRFRSVIDSFLAAQEG